MKTDIQIARECELKPIGDIAAQLGIALEDIEPYGRYFGYKEKETDHVFEAFLGYDFGFASISWYTNFAGNDFKANGDRAYSSYCELSAPFNAFGADWTATAGFVASESIEYATDGLAVTNLSVTAAKELEISERFSLPVSAGLTINPCSEMAYLTFGLSF